MKKELIYIIIIVTSLFKVIYSQDKPYKRSELKEDYINIKRIESKSIKADSISATNITVTSLKVKNLTIVGGSGSGADIILNFSGNGKLKKITGIEKEFSKKDFYKIAVNIGEDRDFMKKQFQELFDNYATAVKNLNDENKVSVLQLYYDFSLADTAALRKEYYSAMFAINKKTGYLKNLKELISDFDSTKLDRKYEAIFSDLYTVKIITGVKEKEYTVPVGIEYLIPDSFNDLDKLEYELRFTKPMAKLTEQNYAEILSNLPSLTRFQKIQIHLKRLGTLLTPVEKLVMKYNANQKKLDSLGVETATAFVTTLKEKNDKLCDTITTLIDNIKNPVDGAYIQLKEYFKGRKDWVKLWLWYSDGIPLLSPYETSPGADIKTSQRTLKENKILLEKYKRKKQYLDTMLTWVPLKEKTEITINEIYKFSDTLSKMQAAITSLEADNDALTKQIDEGKQEAAAGNKKHEEELVKDIWLYAGKLKLTEVTCTSLVKTYRYHDIESNFEPMLKPRNNYDEGVDISIVAENESKPIVITNKIKSVKDITIAAQVLGPLFDNLTQAASQLKIVGGECPGLNTVDEVTKAYNYYNENLKFVSQFDLFQIKSDSSLRRTHLENEVKVDTNSTSYINTYTAEIGAKKIDYAYRVNKLYRFWPAAGFVYSWAKRPEVNIDGDGKFNAKYFNGMNVVVGLKIHPWKTAIMDPDFIFSNKRKPHFDYRKFYTFIGADVTAPAKEYFLGAGIDLWSGLSITGGSHIIRKSQQYYSNGKVESKSYLDGNNFYLGINLDISLAVKAVQFFTGK